MSPVHPPSARVLMAPVVVLASASPTRQHLLASAGVAFSVVPARVDEDRIKMACRSAGRSPEATARALAAAKAAEVAIAHPEALIIGADQILEQNGAVFSKATTHAEARAQLLALRGRVHTLISAVTVRQGERRLWETVDMARLTVRSFSEAFLDGYLAALGDSTLTTVGCYRLESIGVQLFDRIDGDHFTILGLPLLPLLDFLRTARVLPT